MFDGAYIKHREMLTFEDFARAKEIARKRIGDRLITDTDR